MTKKYTGDALETVSILEDLNYGNIKPAWEKMKANFKRSWTSPREVFNRVKDLGTGILTSVVTGNPVAAVKAGVNAIFPGFFGPSTSELATRMDGLQKGLESLANHMGEALNDLRNEMHQALNQMGAKLDELTQFTQEFAKAQERVNKVVQQQLDQLSEKVGEHDKKIRDNEEKIHKEQIRLQDVRSELKDQIRVTNTNLENLHKEQEETKKDFEKYKHQINEKSAKTEQAFEDLQADYTRRNKIIETQIHDNEEQLSNYQENLSNVEFQQKQLNLNYQELAEGLEEQVNLAYQQKARLDSAVNEINDIREEYDTKFDRITQSQLEQDEKIDEAFFAAKRATRKVDELADKLEKHSQRVDNLEKQIEKNKLETQKAKEEAKRANERIDNLLKTQKLLDHSQEEQNFDKLTKSLELKAEEAQLLASLELLKKTQKLITTPAEREWKVGIEKGTEKDIPQPEGYPLKPDSSWAKQYTKEQLQEWGWDTRLLGDNETAPLTEEDKRKPEETQQSGTQQQSEQSQQQQEQQKNLQEVIEETKSQLLEQLKDVQGQINENVSSLEEKTTAPQEDSSSEEEEIEAEEWEKKETKLRQEKVQAKAKLTRSRNKQASLQQQKEQTKSEIVKEQENIKKIQQSLGNPATTPQQKKKLQKNEIEKEDKITKLQKQLEKIEEEEEKQEKEIEQSEEEVKQKLEEIKKVQTQKPYSIESKKIDKEIRDAEQQANEAQQEYIEQQWQEVKKAEEQILNDSPEFPETKQVEDKIQEVKESQDAAAAPQKSMELALFYWIVFMLEYIVYKKNGLPGLVILNAILAILYWHKDKIMKHYRENYKKFGNYLLIIGYIIGNVLAYAVPEQEKYKWPCVIGFNAMLAAVYGYTWYLNSKTVETKQQELVQVQQEFAEEIIQKETEYIDRLQEAHETLEKVKEKAKNSKTVNFSTLSQGVGSLFANEADIKKAQQIYEEIKQKYAKKESDEYLNSPEAQELLKLVQENGACLSSEEQELIQKIQQKQEEINYQEFSQLTNKVPKNPDELKKTLSKLLTNLTEEQIIAIASQSPYLKDNQDKLINAYSHLNKEEKLKLLNSGLDGLQINTVEQKQELLNIRLTTQQEEKSFDLAMEEKENILQLITSQASSSQLEDYKKYGVPLYNASSWQITPEHKKSLLRLAEELIAVEDKEELFNLGRENLEKFPLSEKQEQIVRILAPLQQEYNYSENLLKKLHTLPSRQFLTQREIIPSERKKTTDPYKELKKKVLGKKYKEISWEIKQREKVEKGQKQQELRNSLLPSLLFFAQMNEEDLAYQEYRLSKETFQEKEDWVSVGAINSQQRDLLFLSGFKSLPKYYFFDLLLFVVENIHQKAFTFDWKQWKNISLNFTEELVREWVINGFTYETAKEWVDIGMNPQKDAKYCAWISRIKKLTPEEVLNDYEGEQLWREYQEYEQHYLTEILLIFDGLKDKATGEEKEALKGIIRIILDESLTQEKQLEELKAFLSKFPSDNVKLNSLVQQLEKINKKHALSFSSWNNFLSKYPNLKPEWEKYLELAKERNEKELQRKAEWLNSLTSAGKSASISAVPKFSYLEEKFERLANTYEKMRDYIESERVPVSKPTETEIIEPEPETISEPNKYDELLSSLDKEEQERLKKKKAREEARKKLQETEFNRRQANLSEKDRKLQEEEEKRQRERELAEQEEERLRQAKEAREKALEEDRKIFLDKEAQRIEEAKTRAEKELAFKEEEMKKEKEHREAEIERMQKELEQREKELEQEKELKEKELKEELEKVEATDREERARIEAKIKKIELQNREKLEEEKRKNDEAINEKKAELEAIEKANAESLRAVNEQIRMQKEAEERNRREGEEIVRMQLERRDHDKALERHREECYEAVLDYYFSSSEAEKGTRSPTKSGGKLRDMLNQSPYMEFNLYFGDIAQSNRTNPTWRKAIAIFHKATGGNLFVNKDQLRRLIKEKINSISSY